MNESFKIITIGLVFLFSVSVAAFAGESFFMPVSCSIPEVPGLNAPLIEEKMVKAPDTPLQQGAKNQQEKATADSPTMIQEDKEKEILLAGGKTAYVIVQTVYAR